MDRNFRRLLDTLRAIPPNKSASTTELLSRLKARGHEITSRTLQRDLEGLVGEFGVLCDNRSKPFGWRLPDGKVRISVPEMDWPEALSFYLVGRHLQALMPASICDHLARYFVEAERKLKQTFPDAPLKRWPDKIRVVPQGQPLAPPPVSRAVRDAVTEALLLGRQLEITYNGRKHKTPQKRHIHPLGLVQYGPIFYLAVKIGDFQEPRTLALHRIQRARMLEAAADVPEGFTLDRWVQAGAMGFGGCGSIRLVALFHEGAGTHLLESRLAEDQVTKVQGVDRKDLRVSATVQDTQQLRWWLLGFGERVEVLEPKTLRDEIAGRLEAGAKRYATRQA